jgi:hypothetical protein
MKKVVVMIQPFTIEQNVFVYEDGNKIDAMTVENVDAVVPQLMAYTQKYTDIEQITFIGTKHYNKIYGNKFQENEMKEYGINKIEIKYI